MIQNETIKLAPQTVRIVNLIFHTKSFMTGLLHFIGLKCLMTQMADGHLGPGHLGQAI